MMNSKVLCILELDGSRLCAVLVQVTAEGAEVKRWLSRERPESVSADDPEAVGRWAAEELDRAGTARGGGDLGRAGRGAQAPVAAAGEGRGGGRCRGDGAAADGEAAGVADHSTSIEMMRRCPRIRLI